MKKMRYFEKVKECTWIVVVLFMPASILILAFYSLYAKFVLGNDYVEPETQIIRNEMQLQNLVEEISAGKKYITVKLPVAEDTEKLLKEENYEAFIRLSKENKVIYKNYK